MIQPRSPESRKCRGSKWNGCERHYVVDEGFETVGISLGGSDNEYVGI